MGCCGKKKSRRKVRRSASGLKIGKVRKAMMTKSIVPPVMIAPEEVTPEKRKALEDAGWKFGDASEFLGKSDEETTKKEESQS